MGNQKYLESLSAILFVAIKKTSIADNDLIYMPKRSVIKVNEDRGAWIHLQRNPTTIMRMNPMSIKNILFATFTVFVLSQCTEEEIAPRGMPPAAEAADIAPVATGSMTISGVYTSYEDIEDCKTCTYVVPAGVDVVDGKELGLKPGSVICLDKAVRYGDLDFVNLEGSEESPIRIGTTTLK